VPQAFADDAARFARFQREAERLTPLSERNVNIAHDIVRQ
jgi:hypothetical protein